MKKLFVIAACCLLLVNCKSKKPAKKTTPAGGKTELNVAQKRWPGTSQADLNEGKTIFETKCTRCHGQKEIVTRSEEKWLKVIDKMAPRAKLTPGEKEKLTRYILSYRETYVTTD